MASVEVVGPLLHGQSLPTCGGVRTGCQCHTFVRSGHVRVEALLPWCFVSVTTSDTRRVGFVSLLERSPGRLTLLGVVGRGGCLWRLAVGEASPDLFVGWELCLCSWRRSRSPWRSSFGLSLGLSVGLRISRLLLLLLLRLVPVLRVVHVLPGFESILTLSRGISTLCCRCLTWEVGETVRAAGLWSLICTGLCPSGWRRICRSRLIWIASGTATACSAASVTCRVQASLAPVSIVACLLGRLTQNFVRSLDGLELGYVFFLFAGVAVGVVLQGEPAVLLLHFLAARSGWQVEIGICIALSVRRLVGWIMSRVMLTVIALDIVCFWHVCQRFKRRECKRLKSSA
jgi:hypothetical protein